MGRTLGWELAEQGTNPMLPLVVVSTGTVTCSAAGCAEAAVVQCSGRVNRALQTAIRCAHARSASPRKPSRLFPLMLIRMPLCQHQACSASFLLVLFLAALTTA